MAFAMFTRPDGTPVGIDTTSVISFAPVPPLSSPLAGPLAEGTRIVFNNKTHQDVKELVDEVARRLKAAAIEAIDAMMVSAPMTMAIDVATKPVGARTRTKGTAGAASGKSTAKAAGKGSGKAASAASGRKAGSGAKKPAAKKPGAGRKKGG